MQHLNHFWVYHTVALSTFLMPSHCCHHPCLHLWYCSCTSCDEITSWEKDTPMEGPEGPWLRPFPVGWGHLLGSQAVPNWFAGDKRFTPTNLGKVAGWTMARQSRRKEGIQASESDRSQPCPFSAKWPWPNSKFPNSHGLHSHYAFCVQTIPSLWLMPEIPQRPPI